MVLREGDVELIPVIFRYILYCTRYFYTIMKKVTTIIIALCCTLATQAQQKMNLRDSVSYAIGLDLAAMVKNFDTTLNINYVIKAIEDAVSGKAVLNSSQAQNAIANYMQSRQEADKQKVETQLQNNQEQAEAFLADVARQEGVMRTKSGLLYKIEKLGDSLLPQAGDVLTVHYRLTLPNGEVVDSSYERGEPMSFANNDGEMIAGFLEGIRLLGEGGKAILYLPPALGYGSYSTGTIPPNSALVFEVALLGITGKEHK